MVKKKVFKILLLFTHSVLSESLQILGLNTPGFPVLRYLLGLFKLMSIESMMSSNHFILCCPFLLLPSVFPSIRVFSSEPALWTRWSKYWSFSLNIQGWSLLGLTGLIFLLSKGLSWVFSSTTVRKHQFLKCWFFSCVSSLWFFKNTFNLPPITSILSESTLHVSFGLGLTCWRFFHKSLVICFVC